MNLNLQDIDLNTFIYRRPDIGSATAGWFSYKDGVPIDSEFAGEPGTESYEAWRSGWIHAAECRYVYNSGKQAYLNGEPFDESKCMTWKRAYWTEQWEAGAVDRLREYANAYALEVMAAAEIYELRGTRIEAEALLRASDRFENVQQKLLDRGERAPAWLQGMLDARNKARREFG